MKVRMIGSFSALLLVLSISLASSQDPIPFVPSTMPVVDRMLELAEVRKDDFLYDLGSGDGRILIQAAKKYGTRGVGIDLDPQRVAEARQKAKEEGVSHLRRVSCRGRYSDRYFQSHRSDAVHVQMVQ